MRMTGRAKLRHAVLLGLIAGAHLLLLGNLDLEGRRGLRGADSAPGVLYFIEFPDPENEPVAASSSPLQRPRAPGHQVENKAIPEGGITLPLEIPRATDWETEARRVAGEVAARESEEKRLRPLDRPPAGMGPLPPKPSGHEFGDTQRFEGGEIITWIDDRCYYSNNSTGSPYGANSPFMLEQGLQRPVCKGVPAFDFAKSFEEWKKER
jgi:hypothetical protein